MILTCSYFRVTQFGEAGFRIISTLVRTGKGKECLKNKREVT